MTCGRGSARSRVRLRSGGRRRHFTTHSIWFVAIPALLLKRGAGRTDAQDRRPASDKSLPEKNRSH